MEVLLERALYVACAVAVGLFIIVVKRVFHSINLLFKKFDELRDRQAKFDVNMAVLRCKHGIPATDFLDTTVVKIEP